MSCRSFCWVSWSYAYSIVPWGDTKCIPAFGRWRWWAEPVVRCIPIGQCWCDRLVGWEQPTTKSMVRRVCCTSEWSHANMIYDINTRANSLLHSNNCSVYIALSQVKLSATEQIAAALKIMVGDALKLLHRPVPSELLCHRENLTDCLAELNFSRP